MKGIYLFTAALITSTALSAAPARKSVFLIQPFSPAGDTAASWMARGITDTVISDLSRIRSITVVTDEDRRRALREMELAMTGLSETESVRRTGVLTGADIIIAGSCTVSGKTVRVNIRIIDADKGTVAASSVLDGTIEGIFALQDSLVARLIEESRKAADPAFVIPALTEDDRRAIAVKTVPAAGAFELYSRALGLYESDPAQCIVLCDKALEKQPDYFEALTLSAAAENLSGRASLAAARLTRARAAIRKRGGASGVTTAFLEMNAAPVLFAMKRYDEALKSYESADTALKTAGQEVSSSRAQVLIGMGACKRALGDSAAGLKLSKEGLSLYEKLGMSGTSAYAWALLNTGIILSAGGDYAGSLDWFARATKTFSAAGLAKSQGFALTEAQNGFSFYQLGRFDDSLKSFLAATDTAASLKLDNDENYAWYYWYIAMIYTDKKSSAKTALPYMEKSVKRFRDCGSAETARAEAYLAGLKTAE
jgi:TolB-like protein/tetratricopeptide (TPR) repeat protein